MPWLVLDSAFLALLLALFSLQKPVTLVATGFLCAFYAIVRSNSFRIDMGFLLFILPVTLTLMIPVVFGLNHGYSSLFYVFSTVSALYAAKRFCSVPLSHVRLCLEIVFWIAVFVIALGLVMYWDAAEPLGEIIPGSSTNGLPSYMIVLQIALAISMFLERGRLPLLSSVATFVVALFGLGRGSIAVSALVVLFTCFVNILFGWKNGEKRAVVAGLVGVACLFVGAGGYLWYLFNIVDISQSKWVVWGITDPSRSSMLADYLGKLDWWSMLFGADYSGTSIAAIYAGSPHNSFIRLHSRFGMIGFLLVVLSPFTILASNKPAYIKNTVFVLVLLVLLRATTEPILFPSALDFLYFLYFAMFWMHAPLKPTFEGQNVRSSTVLRLKTN